MIISIGVIDGTKKAFRFARPIDRCDGIGYITEFEMLELDNEGVIEKDTYDLYYKRAGETRFFLQASKDAIHSECKDALGYLVDESEKEVFDVLFTIDNILHRSIILRIDVGEAKRLESQDEKIHEIMLEKKKNEMVKREKEYMKETRESLAKMKISNNMSEEMINNIPDANDIKINNRKLRTKIEPISNEPILVVIREKLNITIDRENTVKENLISGELGIVINKNEYTKMEMKLKNMKALQRFSPHLNKKSLERKIIQFANERKSSRNVIPLAKWSAERKNIPIILDVWIDEEDGMTVVIMSLRANTLLENTEVIFNKAGLIDIECSDFVNIENDFISWKVGRLGLHEEKSCEIKFAGGDENNLFPASVKFTSPFVESLLEVEEIMLSGKNILEYEVKKITEVENFKIVYE